MYYQKENFNGTYDFRSRFHRGFIMESHIHEYSEILYCQKGRCEIFINGEKIYLDDNEFVFIPPNTVHRYNCIDVDVICAVFSNDFIPLYFRETKGREPVTDKFCGEDLENIFKQLPKVEKNDVLLISAYLNLICRNVIRQGEFKEGQKHDGILYQKVISYISENFTEDISLEKIAKKFGYNKKYLSYELHSLTGINFTDLIALYRVEYARELLAENEKISISEIAMKCGFSSINTFNRKFRKMTSQTPSEYRKTTR